MNSRLLSRAPLRWAVRLLSFSALMVCLWLFSRKLSGDITSIAGCGSGEGCAQVLGGRWSEWFQIPVTLLAASVHAGVLVLTLAPVQRRMGLAGLRALATAAVVLGGAAAYFLTLLYGVEKLHCPWCLGLHLTGITVAALILRDAFRQPKPWLGAAFLTGVFLLAGLVAGQIWGPRPQTWLISGTVAPALSGQGETLPGARGREVSYLNGAMKFDTAMLPILGPPDARLVLVEFFDYTCASCRNLASDLKELKKKWPGTFAVIALPTPLSRVCNPHLKPNVPDHPEACELAKLALAVWRAKPEAFPEFHDYLLALPLPATPGRRAEALLKAGTLAGEGSVTSALADPWIAQQLSQHIADFARLTTQSIAMPKLLLPTGGVMHGLAPSTEEFIKIMEKQLQLTPASPAAR